MTQSSRRSGPSGGCWFRGPQNILRVRSDEKIFRQMQQNSARVVYPTRRDFREAPTPWANGKDSVDFPCDEFLEIPLINRDLQSPIKSSPMGTIIT